MPRRKYSAIIVMHNGHKSWSLGCVSEDRMQCEWLEGLGPYDALTELEKLMPNVEVHSARMIHGGGLMDRHTKLTETAGTDVPWKDQP